MYSGGKPIDLRALRQALGCFVTGVTVVTTLDGDGNPRGLTANSFTSVSLNPPLILFCIDKKAGSHGVFQACDSFAVNILSESQKEISGLFASKVEDRFGQVEWRAATTGAPILEGALSWLDCRVEERIVSGDHLVLFGRVLDFRSGNDRPLGYFRGNYVNFGLGQQAITGLQDHRLVLGCIAQQDGRVLLCRSLPDGKWTVPTSAFGDQRLPPKAAVQEFLTRLGTKIEFSFLYSVFEQGDGAEHVIYRGVFSEPWQDTLLDKVEARLFGPEEMPWSDMDTPQTGNMLKRFFHERATAQFGIYVESPSGGHVATLGGPPEPWAEAAFDQAPDPANKPANKSAR